MQNIDACMHNKKFKPQVLQHFLANAVSIDTMNSINTNDTAITATPYVLPKVLAWFDSSSRVDSNPEIQALNMVRDKIDFGGRYTLGGVAEFTHPKTYRYMNLPLGSFNRHTMVAATNFMINLDKHHNLQHYHYHQDNDKLFTTGSSGSAAVVVTIKQQQQQQELDFVDLVLLPFIDCGANACRSCMAPPGSIKRNARGIPLRGPPSDLYIAHRQDQSVLNLLLFNFVHMQQEQKQILVEAVDDVRETTVAINNATYFLIGAKREEREDRQVTVKDLNE